MTDPETPTARALLEAAAREATERFRNPYHIGAASDFAATPSGAELLRRADRPEARVAEGLTVERCAGYDLSDRPDLAPNIVCTLPAGHTGYHLPAPRVAEPDRTALVCSGCHKDVDPTKGMLVHCDACTAAALQRTLDAKAEPDRTAALVEALGSAAPEYPWVTVGYGCDDFHRECRACESEPPDHAPDCWWVKARAVLTHTPDEAP
jgi:hypothetical protein